MAYAPWRSMNGELAEGATDGRYKKVTPNRGGFAEQTAQSYRTDLHDLYFGIHEAAEKMAPGLNRPVHTPGWVGTDPVEYC